jgi:uncharacterized protein YggT (Ycf19 family)
VATYFVWVIDATVLNANKLPAELQKSGVSSEIAAVLVERTTRDMSGAEKEQNTAKVAQVITPKYIDKKIQEAADALITFMKNGSPQPTLDLTDFPGQVRAAGVLLTDEEAAKFDEVIALNENEVLNWVPRAYNILGKAKYAGIFLFVLLLVAELFTSPVGTKLQRTGRIFLHTSIWFFVLWLSVIFLPYQFASKAKEAVQDSTLHALIDAVLGTVRGLFSVQFLGFAIVCAVVAVILYVLRHTRKHIEKIKEVPTARIKSRKQVKLPR